MTTTDPDILAGEVAIAWVGRPGDEPWAREAVAWSLTTARKPERLPPEWRIVAWAVSRRARRPRRYWFVKPGDAGHYGAHDWPLGAVDPHSIVAARASEAMGDPRGARR